MRVLVGRLNPFLLLASPPAGTGTGGGIGTARSAQAVLCRLISFRTQRGERAVRAHTFCKRGMRGMCSGSRAWLFYKISVGGHGDDDQDLEIKEEELEETLLVNLDPVLPVFTQFCGSPGGLQKMAPLDRHPPRDCLRVRYFASLSKTKFPARETGCSITVHTPGALVATASRPMLQLSGGCDGFLRMDRHRRSHGGARCFSITPLSWLKVCPNRS